MLQKIIKEEKGKKDKEEEDKDEDMTLAFIIDMKTRWKSLLPKLKRYMKLKNCVIRAMEKLVQPVRCYLLRENLLWSKKLLGSLGCGRGCCFSFGKERFKSSCCRLCFGVHAE